MSAIDTIRNFFTALEANETETATNALSDDFMCVGWTPKPLDKRSFLGVMADLKTGIPSLMFNLHNLNEQDRTEVGDTQDTFVKGNIQMAGYQSDSFIIPELSLPPIPQMGRSISLPVEDVAFIVSNEQLSRMNITRTAGGGIEGLLHQLGIDAPIVQ